MKHTLSMFAILALLWWVLSGNSMILLLSLGLVSVLFTLFVARRMHAIDGESLPLHIGLPLLRYWGTLLWQIVLANIAMTRLIFSRRPDVNPRVFTVTIGQKTDLGKAVLGNSITLTPGTVTMDINDDQLLVHAINADAAAGVEQGYFDQRIPAPGEGE